MRLDIFLTENGFTTSRAKAQDLILKGCVFVNGKEAGKSSMDVSEKDYVKIEGGILFVSRGGEKLQSAFEYFEIDPHGMHVLDIGSSTGGFSDICLQKGAASVTAVDVGSGQFDLELAKNPKVRLFEKTDIRDFYPDHTFDLIVIDISFISQKEIIDHLKRFSHAGTKIVSLIKPQFEVGVGNIGKNGIVKNVDSILDTLEELKLAYSNAGYVVEFDIIPSAIKGRDGNQEYFLYATA